MQHIVVAAKAGADEPWVADAAAELAKQTGAQVAVVSVDGLELEGLSPMPRSEFPEQAQQTADGDGRAPARRRASRRPARSGPAASSPGSCCTPRSTTPT